MATFISFFIEYVIASIAYIHAVYGGIQTHGLLDLSLLPYPLDQASRLYLGLAQIITLSGVYCNLGFAIFQAEGRNFLFQNWLCSVEFLFCWLIQFCLTFVKITIENERILEQKMIGY